MYLNNRILLHIQHHSLATPPALAGVTFLGFCGAPERKWQRNPLATHTPRGTGDVERIDHRNVTLEWLLARDGLFYFSEMHETIGHLTFRISTVTSGESSLIELGRLLVCVL